MDRQSTYSSHPLYRCNPQKPLLMRPAASLSLVKPPALVKPGLDWKPSTTIFNECQKLSAFSCWIQKFPCNISGSFSKDKITLLLLVLEGSLFQNLIISCYFLHFFHSASILFLSPRITRIDVQYNINVKDAVVTEKPDPLFNYFMESLWMLLIQEGLPVWLVNQRS